jgi:hypothetical protein
LRRNRGNEPDDRTGVLERGRAGDLEEAGDDEPRASGDHDERRAELAERGARDQHHEAAADAEQERALRARRRAGRRGQHGQAGGQPGAGEQPQRGTGHGVSRQERQDAGDQLQRHDEAEHEQGDRLALGRGQGAELQQRQEDARRDEREQAEGQR